MYLILSVIFLTFAKMFTKNHKMMKNKKMIMMAFALIAMVAIGGCNKKREVSVDKLNQTIIQSVMAEQRDSGRVLTVDTIFLNKTEGDNFSGELRGHVNDTTEVVYDLQVTDEGEELSAEWTLRQ